MTDAIKIDKRISLPSTRSKYPFAEMKVGDSFAVPLSGEIKSVGKNGECDKTLSRIRDIASYHQNKLGMKFTTRTLKGEGVIRVWRTA